jgi:hypothetical protein
VLASPGNRRGASSTLASFASLFAQCRKLK